MTYGFKNTPIMPRSSGDGLIATALDGVVYTENSRLHVKGNTAHYVYMERNQTGGARGNRGGVRRNVGT